MPLILGALRLLAAPVLGSLFGKGLQVDAQQRVPRGKGFQLDAQQRPNRRVPRLKIKINFRNKPMSNFDIMNWVKELKIKNFDGVFNKDSRQWAYYCGIINLDSKNGPGTHWVCCVDSFYFDHLGLPPAKNSYLSNDTILHNIKKKKKKEISVLCGYFCPFFIKKFKKFKDDNSIYNILYKSLDPVNPSKNETILKDYFINYGDV